MKEPAMKEPENAYDKERLVVLPEDSRLNEEIIRKLDQLFEHSSPREIRDNILEVYLNYMIFCNETLPVDFEKLADNLYNLLKFLEFADKDVSQLKDEEVKYTILEVA